MRYVGEMVGHPSDPRSSKFSPKIVDNSTFIGVEIELENVRGFGSDYFKDCPFWSITDEPSLRNGGREYITGLHINNRWQPIRGKDLVDTLAYFNTAISRFCDRNGSYPELNERTSIHIHIDVRELSPKQLVNFALLYVIFEPIFFNLFGKGRKDNPYCRPVFTNHECKARLSKLLTSGDRSRSVFESGDKYDACNFKAVRDQGSLEFRLHEGTFDGDRILYWTNLLLILKNKAIEEDFNIQNLPQQASELGMIEFLRSIFGKYSKDILVDVVDNDILQGIRTAQDILIYEDLTNSNTTYKRSKKGERAEDNSILHKWAGKNKRKLFIGAGE